MRSYTITVLVGAGCLTAAFIMSLTMSREIALAVGIPLATLGVVCALASSFGKGEE